MARKSDNAALNVLADSVFGPEGSRKLRTDASVSVDSMSLTAEMKVDSGHDLYLTENNTIATDGWVVGFDAVAGLDLSHIQAVENRTKGFIYSTKGATVTTDSITLIEANQQSGVTEMETTDDVEIVYRGDSRFDKFKFTADDLNVVFSNSTIGVTGDFYPTTQDVNISGGSIANTSFEATQATAGSLKTEAHQGGVWSVTTDVKSDVANLKMHSGISVVMAVDQDLTADWVSTNNITTRDVSGYNRIGVFVEATPNDSENGQIRVVGELGSGNLYEIDGVSEKTVFTSGAAVKKYYEFDIGTLTNIRIQVKAGTVGATAGQMSIYLNEAYRY